MNLRASFTRICRFPQVPKDVASNRVSIWSTSDCRPAALVRFWSISHRTLSTTNARKLDLVDVMVPPEDKDPSNIFRAHLAEGTLTRPLAVSCLQGAVRLNQTDSRLGEAAIEWLWDKNSSIKYPDDVDLINPTALLLVREGKEELLWDWMSQEPRKLTSTSKHDRSNRDYDWRSAALRGLVEAKTCLATDRIFDAALETFSRGLRVSYYLPVLSASNFCHKMLCSSESRGPSRSYEDMRKGLVFTNTNPNLWDEFYMQIGKGDKNFAKQQQAEMMLYHPQHPNPWPYFEWWRDAKHTPEHLLHRIESRSSSIIMVERSRDLRLVLNHLGNHREARWIKDFANKIFPRDRILQGKSTRERLHVGKDM